MRGCPARYVLPVVLTLILTVTGCGQPEPPAPLILDIPVVTVTREDVPIPIEMVGSTRGSVDIPIRARVEGFLESLDFKEGREVSQGQLLYTIDARPFEAKVVEAKGYLAESRTMLAKAKSDLARIKPLAEMKAVSQQDLDSAVAEYKAAQGSVQASEAQLDQANIELSYTRIESPIDGRIGISQAKVGEFVGKEPNPVVLNYVSQADPIRVRFSVNERLYLQWARRFAEFRKQPESELERRRELELILADGTVHPDKGYVVAYDAAVNPTTGTFTLEADFPNPDNIVLAGQFARVRAVAEIRKDALLVPQRAVNELQGNYRVFVIKPDNTVELRDIEAGPRIDNMWLIDKGLKPGERVAVEGILRLKEGMTVNPVTAEAAAAKNKAETEEAGE
ncbi:MAG: efflux RND transporter periplasmic adaptor subunit [Pseudomonadota bacterium]